MRIIEIRAAITFAAVTIALLDAKAEGAAQTKPNVLMVIIDDVAANVHSVGQASPVRTPNIQRLAARGT